MLKMFLLHVDSATDSAGTPAVVTGTVTVQLSDVDDHTSTFPTSCGYAATDSVSGMTTILFTRNIHGNI